MAAMPAVSSLTAENLQQIEEIVRQAVCTKAEVDAQVQIIVAGASKAGKSLFIRKFLNYPAGDPDAPKFGKEDEHRTTMLLNFQRDEKPGLLLFDALGIGHGIMKVTASVYCKKLELEKYDVCLLMSANDFTKEELVLIRHLQKLKKPCFLLSSHFDEHITDERERSAVDKRTAEAKCRARIAEKVGQLTGNDATILEKLFFIDNRRPGDHDFPNLQTAIEGVLTNEKKKLIEKRMFLLSADFMKRKAEAHRKDVPLLSLPGGLAGLSPIPGTDIAAELAYIVGHMIRFYRDFSLNDDSIKSLCNTYNLNESCIPEIRAKFKYATTDVTKIKETLKSKEAILSVLNNFAKLGATIAIMASDDAIKFVPVVGTAIGCAIGAVTGFFTTRSLLSKIINGCEHDALILVEELRLRLAAQQEADGSLSA